MSDLSGRTLEEFIGELRERAKASSRVALDRAADLLPHQEAQPPQLRVIAGGRDPSAPARKRRAKLTTVPEVRHAG
jgi:hypothetical protein